MMPVNPGDISESSISDKYPTVYRKRHNYDGPFGVYQYVVGAAWMFTGTIMLEGVVTSLMAKSACGKLDDTFLNAGFLATLAGTAGRVVADAIVVGAGFMHSREGLDFVNSLFIQVLVILILAIWLVQRSFYHLMG